MPVDTDASGWEASDALTARRQAEALCDLYDAGHWEQVAAQGQILLESAPDEELAHYVVGLARLKLKRVTEAWGHVHFLLTNHPDWPPSHEAASLYYRTVRHRDQAWSHIQTAIQLNPNVAGYHASAALLAVERKDLPGAIWSIGRARQLAPEDPNIAWLAIELQGANQTTAREAWHRIREFENALRLDPNNSDIHASIGSIYLEELDMPREAEASFRSALLHDPAHAGHQKALFQAVAQQRMLYRLLSIPQRAFRWLANYCRGVAVQPWRIIFLLFGFKIVLAFLFWIAVVAIIFWPACKIYEWLVISEIECVAEASNAQLRFKRALGRRPFWLRFMACVGLILGSWLAFFAVLGIVIPGFVTLGILAGVHFVFTLVLFLMRKARSSHGRWSAEREQASRPPAPPVLRSGPPPLPR